MSSDSLEATQRWMQSSVSGSGLSAAGNATPAAYLQASPQLSAAAGLAIYQRSYQARLLECMNLQFPALRHALGPPLFADFAGEYLQGCPPYSPTLHQLGDRFAEYLQSARPDKDKPESQRETWIDFMVDLAGFEYALMRIFDAPGSEGQPLATASLADNQLRLQACLSLQQYRYPVAEYYQQVRRGQNPGYPQICQVQYLLVRKDFVTSTLNLSEPQHCFFHAMFAGAIVDDALSCVSQSTGQPLPALQEAWSGSRERWIEAGVFVTGGQCVT